MPHSRRAIASQALPAPRFRYTPVVEAGGFVFVSGLVGLDAKSGALVAGGAFAQGERILANLNALLDEQGWQREQIAMARLFVVGFAANFPEVNRAWEAAFDGALPPARTSIGVAELPLGALVEMDFQLAVG